LAVLLLTVSPSACRTIDGSEPLPVQPEVKSGPAAADDDSSNEEDDDEDKGSDEEGEPTGPVVAGEDPADATDGGAPQAPADGGTAHQPLLKTGLHPDASDAFRALGVTAANISYTLVNASTHQKDGEANGKAYSAATDLKTTGMTDDEIKALLGKLGAAGFAAWYRKPGTDNWPANGTTHIHAVWVACPMKSSLQEQVRDWLDAKNGTSNHADYKYFSWPDTSKELVRASFAKFNP
jgi:hypothetical protein